MRMQDYEFWFVVGSQFLYGPEVLETVANRAAEMTEVLNASGNLPCKIVYKVTAKTNKEIADVVREANYDPHCAGIITWCHTFSPSKMWINGFVDLQKPYCHFATQYNREIPNEEIDMDFMNLNQAAHGDREHGFIAARLRMPRKIIAGYWQDEEVQKRLGRWMRTAVGVAVSRELKVMRFGDNMREVAVTEGDKVEVQAKLGWQVNTWAVGDLVKVMNEVTDAEIDELMDRSLPRQLRRCHRQHRRHPLPGPGGNRHQEDAGRRRLQGFLQHLPRPVRHGTAARPGQPAPDGPGLRLRRRGRLESGRHDRHYESHG